jgi:hypothetical protein
MLKFLLQPYPFNKEIQEQIKFNLLVGGIVAFILIALQPFGISEWHTSLKLIKLLGYGFVSFIVPSVMIILLYFFIDKNKVEAKYVVWKEIFWLLLVLTFIAFANVIYSNILGISHLSRVC